MKSRLALLAALLGVIPFVGAGPGAGAPPQTQCAPAAAIPAATTPVAYWSTEARCAIVPAGPGGIFGLGELRQQVPGRGGRVHGHRPRRHLRRGGGDRGRLQAVRDHAQRSAMLSPAAAIATAAHDTLVGLQPQLGLDATQQAILDGDYTAYLAAIPDGDGEGRTGSRSGEQVAAGRARLRANDGLEQQPDRSPTSARPPAGPGVWQPDRLGAGARPAPARDAAARARERFAVPARRRRTR